MSIEPQRKCIPFWLKSWQEGPDPKHVHEMPRGHNYLLQLVLLVLDHSRLPYKMSYDRQAVQKRSVADGVLRGTDDGCLSCWKQMVTFPLPAARRRCYDGKSLRLGKTFFDRKKRVKEGRNGTLRQTHRGRNSGLGGISC